MRTVVTNRGVGRLGPIVLISCLFIQASPSTASLRQGVPNPAAPAESASRTEPVNRSQKAAVLVRNTSSATPARAETTTTTAKKSSGTAGKNTISRCWKRLMDNIREVRHAHRKK